MERKVETTYRQLWNTDLEQKIKDCLHAMRFGTITLVVQDGRVIQIDRNEKIRLKQ
jgi:hypothetical protein